MGGDLLHHKVDTSRRYDGYACKTF